MSPRAMPSLGGRAACLLLALALGCGGPAPPPPSPPPATAGAPAAPVSAAPREDPPPAPDDAAAEEESLPGRDDETVVREYLPVWKALVARESQVPAALVEERLTEVRATVVTTREARWLSVSFHHRWDWVAVPGEDRMPILLFRSPLWGVVRLIPLETWLSEAQIATVLQAGKESPHFGHLSRVRKEGKLRYRTREEAEKAFQRAFGVAPQDIVLSEEGEPLLHHNILGYRGTWRGPCPTRLLSLVTGKAWSVQHVCAIID